MPETKGMTRGQKAAATRKANEAKRKAEVEFKKVTSAEQSAGPVEGIQDVVDIMKMNIQDLINYAEKAGIDTYAKTKTDILVELGVTQRKGGRVFVRPQPSAEKLRYLMERNAAIPQNTIFPEDEFEDWLKIVAEEPMAFNGADLSDKTSTVIHTLHQENVCACGAKVIFPIHPETGKPCPVVMCEGMPHIVLRNGHRLTLQKCISTSIFRKYVWHEIPKEG